LEVSIDTLDREKLRNDAVSIGLRPFSMRSTTSKAIFVTNTIQINSAVDLDNLDDLPALAVYCEERGFLLHT